MAQVVLALDSSPEYRTVISCLLEQADQYDASICEAWDEFVSRLDALTPELVIVNFADVEGDADGLVGLRRRLDIPIMALVASSEESKAALRAGADYDLPKPFDPEIFIVALTAVLRRAVARTGGILPMSQPIVVDDLKVFPDRRTVERDGRRQVLSPTEWALLAFLLANPGRVFTRRELAAGAWGPGYASRAGQAELYVSRVRRKIERHPQRPRLIETVRGRGYRLAWSTDDDDRSADAAG